MTDREIAIMVEGCRFFVKVLGGILDLQSLPADVHPLLIQAFNSGQYEEIPQTLIPESPDWDRLLNRLLSGDLFPLFQSITFAAFSNPVLLVARNDIYGAISNPAIADRIAALRAGLDMLLQSGYEISDSDRTWNQAMSDLNFPDEVRL